MSLVLRRCFKANGCLLSSNNTRIPRRQKVVVKPSFTSSIISRRYSEEKSTNEPQFSHSSIMVENGLNVHELPLVIRKLRSIPEFDDKTTSESTNHSHESLNYGLIQEEFKQCLHLRHVFSLLSKCTKITPNIALGAIERICELEKNPPPINFPDENVQINLAKGAILDKLLKVVMKTEDTQTILNILNTVSPFMEPYKPKFCDELLLRVVDSKLSIEQLCEFTEFLITNKSNFKYSDTIDKLWVGFLEKEQDINEKNIVKLFQVLSGFKTSKRTIFTLLEQKFSDLWRKMGVDDMQLILEVFDKEKYVSCQSFEVVGTWLYTNIHAVGQDSMLDFITKLTRLQYTDAKVEKAIEKYMKLKGAKIDTPVLIVGILNYCLQFQIRNVEILNACSEYYINNAKNVPNSFLRSIVYPFGYLNFDPGLQFWNTVEFILNENLYKFSTDDICSILLSFIYVGKYPLGLVNRLFNPEYLIKVTNSDTMKRFHMIDMALSLECIGYVGPLLPKDQWYKPISQDPRIKNILKKTKDVFESVAGDPDKLSVAVMVPHIYPDETYLLDVMLHPAGLGSNTFNWKSKTARNENMAILIHLPDHYCSDNEQLIGPQIMRKKHLRILGLKVVSLKYSVLSQFYTSCNISGFKKYLVDSIGGAEECTNVQ